MAMFQPFKSATKAGVPDYMGAEIARAKLEQQAHEATNKMKRSNIAGGINAYDKVTGKDTPIKDFLSEALRGEGAPVEEAVGIPTGFNPTDPSPVGPEGLMNSDISAALRDTGEIMDVSAPVVDAVDAVPGVDGVDASGVPILSAAKGVSQLMEGDVGGAAKTGVGAYLSTLGPWGMAAGALLSMLK